MEIFNKYLEIKQDLVNNLQDLFIRQNFYTKKYRGNERTNINVAIDYTTEGNKMFRIFIQYGKWWIRDVMVYNSKGIISTEVKHNLND